MTKEHLWNVIKFDDKGLTSASHRYSRIVARWLEVLASYAGPLNLMVIMSETVLEQLKIWRVALILG